MTEAKTATGDEPAGAPPSLSVVIPTRDRRERLAETLEALAAQRDVSGAFEVIVVDDGSRDDTAELLTQMPNPGFSLRALRQEATGPAAARNRGIAEARAPRILLLGDDTRPAPGCLAHHLDGKHGERGLQGHIDWDLEREITPLMAFLAPAGPQFYFASLHPLKPIPYTALLGSNLSAPTHWLREEPYDEGFPHAAFEDTELGFRWRRRGWRTLYLPTALCWHRHHYRDLEPFLARQRRAGAAAAHGLRKHPEMAPEIAVLPMLTGARNWLRHALRRATGGARQEDSWDLACRAAYFQGLFGRAR